MNAINDLVGTCRAALIDLVGRPARRLTSTMDDFDELWLTDLFLDQPDPDRSCC